MREAQASGNWEARFNRTFMELKSNERLVKEMNACFNRTFMELK